MILVRNCPHNNGVYTFIDEKDKVVIKSSYSLDGIARLNNEYAGYNWYFKKNPILNDSRLELFENENKLYSRLYVKFFSGAAGNCYRHIEYNKEHLMIAVKTYNELWPRVNGGLSPLHGDFSLGNLIFNGSSLTIIDWEHFQLDVAPWGFDLVNLLYETVFFSFKGKEKLSNADCKVFVEVKKAISELLEPNGGFQCSHDDLTKFISANTFLWGSLVNKLPVMKFSNEQYDFLQVLEREG